MTNRSQRVRLVVSPFPNPSDTTPVEAAIDDAELDPESLVAVVGKVVGTGMQNDYGRELADRQLRSLIARRLSIPAEDVSARIAIILSGGCAGVLAPHLTLIAREWCSSAEATPAANKALVVGRSHSPPILPEEIGRMGQILKVADATRLAMADAGLADRADVHQVLVKGPTLTRRSIREAHQRGQSVVSLDTSAGPSGALCYANDGAALGVALALGEVELGQLSDSIVRRDWSLFSEVAATSSGGEKREAEVLVLGNASDSRSELRVGHGVMRDFFDTDGIKAALRSAGLMFECCPSQADKQRVVQVFAKSIIPGSNLLRNREIALLDDADAGLIAKATGAAVIASVVGHSMIFVSGGEANSHQGPPDGSPIAAVVRTEQPQGAAS